MQVVVSSIPCVCILLCIPAQSLWIPHGVHQESTRTPPIDCFNFTKSKVLLQSTPNIILVDSMRSGVEWRTLEKDWRWTHVDYRWATGGLQVDSMDYIWTGGGLHEDL